MPQVSDSPTAVADEPIPSSNEFEVEEELEEEAERATTKKKKKRKFHPDNAYHFNSLDLAKEGLKHLTFDDDTNVPENVFRPIKVIREANGNEEDKGFVLARSANDAALKFLENKGFILKLADPKKKFGAGRTKTKIETTMIEYGKLLAQHIFRGCTRSTLDSNQAVLTLDYKDNADPHFVSQWEEYFGSNGTHDHYFDEDGRFKSPNK